MKLPTITDLIMSSAGSLAWWKAEKLCPDNWGRALYDKGWIDGQISSETSLLRLHLRKFSRKFQREVGFVIRQRMAERLAELKQRRAA